MSVIKTFLDSSVLIAAATGRDAVRLPALRVLADPLAGVLVQPAWNWRFYRRRLYNGRKDEAGFYRAYLSEAECCGDLNRTYEIGRKEAERHGIAAIDALHLPGAPPRHPVAPPPVGVSGRLNSLLAHLRPPAGMDVAKHRAGCYGQGWFKVKNPAYSQKLQMETRPSAGATQVGHPPQIFP